MTKEELQAVIAANKPSRKGLEGIAKGLEVLAEALKNR